MKPDDFIYREAFRQFMRIGYSDRDAGTVASEAVRKWRRNMRAKDAIAQAIQAGRRQHVKVKK